MRVTPEFDNKNFCIRQFGYVALNSIQIINGEGTIGLIYIQLQHLLIYYQGVLLGQSLETHHPLQKNLAIYHFFTVAQEPQYLIFEMDKTLQSRNAVEGRGMDLAIAKRIAVSQSRQIWAESVDTTGKTLSYFERTKNCAAHQVP